MLVDFMEFQHLSVRFYSKQGEDVCLILCDPTPDEVVGMLESLASLCPAAAPADLAALALSCLQPNSASPSVSWSINDPSTYHMLGNKKEDFKREEETADLPLIPQTDLSLDCSTGPDINTVKVEVAEDEDEIHHSEQQQTGPRPKPRGREKRRNCLRQTVKREPGQSGTGDEEGDRPKRKRRQKMGSIQVIDNHSLPPKIYDNPEKQELLDRLAFRRKNLKKGDRSSTCPECGTDNFTELTLRKHLRDVHSFALCKGCYQPFPSEEAAENHGCPLRSIPCNQCTRTFKSMDGWIIHRQAAHEGVHLICQVCGNKLRNRNSLRRHLETLHGILPPPVGRAKRFEQAKPVEALPAYPCDLCGRSYKSRISVTNHKLLVHGGKQGHGAGPVTCEQCGRTYPTKYSLSKHRYAKHRSKKTEKDEI